MGASARHPRPILFYDCTLLPPERARYPDALDDDRATRGDVAARWCKYGQRAGRHISLSTRI
jgi:hypothetical protein